MDETLDRGRQPEPAGELLAHAVRGDQPPADRLGALLELERQREVVAARRGHLIVLRLVDGLDLEALELTGAGVDRREEDELPLAVELPAVELVEPARLGDVIPLLGVVRPRKKGVDALGVRNVVVSVIVERRHRSAAAASVSGATAAVAGAQVDRLAAGMPEDERVILV